MRTAKETRQAAWDLLRAGSYGTYLIGAMALGCVGVCVVFLLLGLFLAGAVAIIGKMPDSVTAFLDAMGQMEPRAFVSSLAKELSELLPVIWTGLGVWTLLLVSFGCYLIGFSSWGNHAMAIACVRRGLTVAHAFSGWGHGWRMFGLFCRRAILVVLWALLLIVPGVRALYSYALAPYLQVDHPDWEAMRCLKESKRLMEGHRMALFFLHISFIGWYLLAFFAKKVVPLVGGLADLLLTPYPETAFALFYEARLDADERAAEVRGEPPRPNGDDMTAFSQRPGGCVESDTTEEERNKTHED